MRKTILSAMLLAPSLALASGYALPNSHPRDLAVCASGVAAQDDAAAAFANPAALARIWGPSVRIGGGAVTVGAKWTDPTPGATQPPYDMTTVPPTPIGSEPATASLSTQFTPFPTVAASYGWKLDGPGDKAIGVGIALQPFGGSIVKWPADWAGRYRITEVDREVFSGTLGLGLQFHPQVRVGGGLVYYYTTQTFKQKLWQQGVAPPATINLPDATGKLGAMTGGAFSYDLSFELEPVKDVFTIALDYKHKATQELSGDVHWTDLFPPLAAAPGALTSATSASETLTIPNTLNVGAAYRVVKPVLVMATFTLDRWVVYDFDNFTGNNGSTVSVPRHYKNGQTYRAGVAWDLLEMLTLRAGVQRDVSGLDRRFYSPTLPDASSWGGSLGATVRFAKAFSVDAGAFYAKMDKVTVPADAVGREPGVPPPGGSGAGISPTGTFRGSYEPNAFVFSLSLNWQPGAM